MPDWAIALLSIIVGQVTTYFIMRNIERQKWQQEKKEKLLEIKRDAIAAALEWIEPMRNAQIRAESLVIAAIHGDFDHEKFLKKFPYLIGELVKKEIPAKLRAVLPDTIYPSGHRIVREFEETRVLGVKYGEEATIMKKPLAGFQECSKKLDTINQKIEALETELRNEFQKTFN
jgi:hypothetical protein